MRFLLEIEGSVTGSKSFYDRQSAEAYFKITVSGFEYLKDKTTNVVLWRLKKDQKQKPLLVRFRDVFN